MTKIFKRKQIYQKPPQAVCYFSIFTSVVHTCSILGNSIGFFLKRMKEILSTVEHIYYVSSWRCLCRLKNVYMKPQSLKCNLCISIILVGKWNPAKVCNSKHIMIDKKFPLFRNVFWEREKTMSMCE